MLKRMNLAHITQQSPSNTGLSNREVWATLSIFSKNSAAAAAAKSLQSCPTLRHHRQQPTRLRRPWDSPGKNTGVGCHFLLQCMKEKSESEVSQSCPTPSNPMDCSLPDSSVHGISRQEYWSGVPLPSPKNSLVISNSNSCTSVSKPNWIKRAKKRNQFPTLTPLHL